MSATHKMWPEIWVSNQNNYKRREINPKELIRKFMLMMAHSYMYKQILKSKYAPQRTEDIIAHLKKVYMIYVEEWLR